MVGSTKGRGGCFVEDVFGSDSGVGCIMRYIRNRLQKVWMTFLGGVGSVLAQRRMLRGASLLVL